MLKVTRLVADETFGVGCAAFLFKARLHDACFFIENLEKQGALGVVVLVP